MPCNEQLKWRNANAIGPTPARRRLTQKGECPRCQTLPQLTFKAVSMRLSYDAAAVLILAGVFAAHAAR